MKYLIYVNVTRRRARLHRDDGSCVSVKVHGGIDKYEAGHWEDYVSREAGMAALDNLRELGYEAERCAKCAS